MTAVDRGGKQRLTSSNTLFVALIITSFSVSLIACLLLVSNRAETTLYEFARRAHVAQGELTKSNLEQYLQTRMQVLRDVATTSTLVNGVMGTGISSVEVDELLADTYVLGRKEALHLIDIEGDLVYGSMSDSGLKVRGSPWFRALIDGGSQGEVILNPISQNPISSSNELAIRLAVPVNYGSSTEGILVADLSHDIDSIIEGVSSSPIYAIRLIDLSRSYTSVADISKFILVYDEPLAQTGLSIQYFVHPEKWDTVKNEFLFDLAIAIIGGLLISYVLLFFIGERAIINPLRKLKISERRLQRSEEEARTTLRSLEQQRFALDQHSIVLTTDRSGRIIDANERFCEISGYSRDQILGRLAIRFLHRRHDAAFWRAVRDEIIKTGVWSGHLHSLTKDGVWYVVAATIAAFNSDDGEVQSYIAIQTDVTVSVRQKEALAASEARLNIAMEGSDIGFWDWDILAKDVYMSPRARDMLGLGASAELAGFGSYYIEQLSLSAADRIALRTALAEHLKHGTAFDVEFRVLGEGGVSRTIKARGKAKRDENGRAIRMAGTVDDVSVRVERERELRELNQRLSLAADAAKFGVFERDLATNTITWDKWMCRLHGFPEHRTKIHFEEWISLVHPADRTRVCEERDALMLGAPGVDSEYRIVQPNGTVRRLAISCVMSRDESGRPSKITGINFDITKSKRAKAYLEGITRESPSLLAYIDRQGIVKFANSAYQSWLCEVDMTMLESNFVALHDRSIQAPLEEHFTIALGGDVAKVELYAPGSSEDSAEHAEGAGRFVRFTLSPDIDESSSVQGVFASGDDITHFRQAERAHEQARRAAESANTAKSNFLATMSHEVRTPMNGVIGMAQLMLETPLTAEQREYMSSLTVSAKSMLSLVNSILDLSKIEAGRIELEHREFDLEGLLRECGESMGLRAQEKGLALVCPANRISQRWVVGDDAKIRQILMNLIGNSIKFSERGYVAVECRLVVGEELTKNPSADIFEFCVTDTGPGIDPRTKTHLFDRFSQADSSTTRKYGGSGLGLAICKELAELMGGTIAVESAIGRGTTFKVQLPLARPHRTSEVESKKDLKGVDVLIVASNTPNLRYIDEVLSHAGANCRGYKSVSAAARWLRKLEGHTPQPSIIILDSMVSDLEVLDNTIESNVGVQLAKRLLLVPFDRSVAKLNIEKAKFEGQLKLPVNSDALLETISSLLRGDAASGVVGDLINKIEKNELQFRGRILVVDDNTTNRLVAKGMLMKFGIDVEMAENGHEALSMLNDAHYDLVLMDCQMPVMDGYEATRIIRNARVCKHTDNGIDPNIPIVAVTANALTSDWLVCKDAGMNDYLPKPIEMDHVAEILSRWLPERSRVETVGNKITTSDSGRSVSHDIKNHAQQCVFDFESLKARVAGDFELAKEVAYSFVDDFDGQLCELQNAIESEDQKEVSRLGHRLRGACANVSGIALVEILNRLEQAGREANYSRMRSLLCEAEAARVHLKAAIEQRFG